ncbi:hypothetical protein ACFQU2_07770 [Siccirubricoccus deserti]
MARSAGTTSTAPAPSFSMQQSNSRWKGSMIQREASYFSTSSGRPFITARGLVWAWW